MAGVDIDVIERLARAALASGDSYLFCRVLPVIVGGGRKASEWVFDYLRSLAHLGLNGAALELIDRLSEVGAFRDVKAVQEMAAPLRDLPPRRIAWTSLRRRFAANLAAWEKRDAAQAEALKAAWDKAADRYELHQCSDGNYQIKEAGAVWPPRWLPFIDDHRARATRRVLVERNDGWSPPIGYDGIGLGWELLQGYTQTGKDRLDTCSAIYVVEPSLEAAAIALHLHDWREVLADPRVLWFVGEGANDRFRETLGRDTAWPLVDAFCVGSLLPGPAGTAAAVLPEIRKDRDRQAVELRQALEAKYAGRDAAWWARRFEEAMDDRGRASDRPLRVLGITSIHTSFLQYSMRDCLRAIERLGHRTRLLTEPAPHLCIEAVEAIRTDLDFEPDLILLLSRLRDEMPQVLPAVVPLVTWDQDMLPWVFDPARKPQLGPNDFLMGYAALGLPQKFGWPEHRCRYCVMAGSPDTYSAEPLPPEELEPYRCDVSYVSHASAPVEEELAHVEKWFDDPRVGMVIRTAVQKLLPGWLAGGSCPGPVMTAVIDAGAAAGARFSWEDIGKLTGPIHRLAGRVFRHVALGWVADWADRTGRTFCLWGNGWERHPRLGRYARGPAANGHMLRCIYQASRINLQLMGTGFFHQRALDGLMAGGFFLGRRSDADGIGPTVRETMALVDRYGIRTAAQLAALPDAAAQRKIELGMLTMGEDPRALCPEWVENRRLTAASEFIDERVPDIGEILFASPAEFEAKAERFLADAALRARHAAEMRTALMEHYSYDARMREMLLFIRDGYRAEAGTPSGPQSRPGAVTPGVRV